MGEETPDRSRFMAWTRRLKRTDITLLVMIFALSVGEGGARFLAPVYLSDQGNAVASIGLLLSTFGVAALASRLVIVSIFRPSAVRWTIALSGLASTTSVLLMTTTSSVPVFTVLIGIHGIGWGIISTVLLTLVLQGKGKRSAAAVIGFYIGVEGLGRAVAPAVAGILGGTLGAANGMRVHIFIYGAAVLVGVLVFRNADQSEVAAERSDGPRRINLTRFRNAPLAAWVAMLTGFYLNTTNAVLNVFFPLLGLSLGFTLGQIGLLAATRSAVSALIRFAAAGLFKVVPFRMLLVPLYVVNAVSTALIGTVAVYPIHFLLWVPNGASRGVLRVGTMAAAMEDSGNDSTTATAALIGAGHDAGRIAGPAIGGLVAAEIGLSAMMVVMPMFFLVVLLPVVLRARTHDADAAAAP